VLVHLLKGPPEQLDEALPHIAAQADLEPALAQRALRQAEEQLAAARANGRA
jgi:hypothetical protein